MTREANLLRESRFIQEAENAVREEGLFVRLLRSISRFFRIIVLRLQSAYDNFLKAYLKHRKVSLLKKSAQKVKLSGAPKTLFSRTSGKTKMVKRKQKRITPKQP